jgi:lysophospholipase L1-like esterase
MKTRTIRLVVIAVSILLGLAGLAGCGGGDSALENSDPGINDVSKVDAFGDSVTGGGQCNCAPYPGRTSAEIGKIVYNSGKGGSRISSGVSRTQSTINQYHPGFMLILYGVNDVIHGGNVANVAAGLNQIVNICRQNNVVPVLATYPIPIKGHSLFAGGTAGLNENIRALASSAGVPLVDLEREFADPNGVSNFGFVYADPSLMMPDGLHPNDMGTQIMALAFADLF